MSERWAQQRLYYPSCGLHPIARYENNRPVANFHCPGCAEEYELKSKRGTNGPKVPDGAFGVMIEIGELAAHRVPA